MEIRGKKVLVLGGAGLVGLAICHKLVEENPREIIVSSLSKDEALKASQFLSETYEDVIFTPSWGNVFVREDFKDHPPSALLSDSDLRSKLIADALDDLSPEILQASALYRLLLEHRPHIVVDCINSATAVAYQDVYSARLRVQSEIDKFRASPGDGEALISEVEKLMGTLYVPQLIRHVQIFYQAMREARTGVYLKIGTSGTGGMGLNLPYTHSEEKPSRMLLSKSSVAGAHTLLLFLMGRTPGGPIIKEVKPAAVIAWKGIAHGEIMRKGKPLELFDCPPEGVRKLGDTLGSKTSNDWHSLGRNLETAYIDTGENGIFSTGEFEAISASGQMEFITPEEIAQSVVYEIRGGNTGYDIVNALDTSVMGPTYRAGILRGSALQKLKELESKYQTDSVSFELIGPLVSKLLFEAQILQKVCHTMSGLRAVNEAELCELVDQFICHDVETRASILSVGIGILLKDGETLLRGPELKVPQFRGKDDLEVTSEKVDRWACEGWVDLRQKNLSLWKRRIDRVFKDMQDLPHGDTSSRYIRTQDYWLRDERIAVGKLVGWVLATEEASRMKD
jgi:hypothetical protein